MKVCLYLVTAVLLVVLSTSTKPTNCMNDGKRNDIKDCPPWTLLNKTSGNCECGNDINSVVDCNSETLDVSVKACFCMTYSRTLNKTFVTFCHYTCSFFHHFKEYKPIDTKNLSELNSRTCGEFNRTGLMCGECIPNHAPSVYSYDLTCVECEDYKYNWLKYIAVAYGPLTVFYIVIVVLKVSVLSGPMIAYVAASQMIAAPGLSRFYYNTFHFQHHTMVSLVESLYAIWNLDFFRGLYQPFCLHPNMSILLTISLDYIVGLYPLLLILITYILVQLHDHYIVVSRLWSPIYKCCSLFRSKWNIMSSLVDVFVTFLILSYVKILNVSADLLTGSGSYYNIHGERIRRSYLFVNGSMPAYSRDHIPYAIVAVLMALIFNVLPLFLLCVYPCHCFQRCLNLSGCTCRVLHVFMDTFQGIYKEEPLDCRYFAGFYLFLRCVNIVLYAFTRNAIYYSGATILFTVTLLLLEIFKPYKRSIRNTVDIVIFLIVITMYAVVFLLMVGPYMMPISTTHYVKFGELFISIVYCVLPLYGVCLLVYQILMLLRIVIPHFNICHKLISKLHKEYSFSDYVGYNRECTPLLK